MSVVPLLERINDAILNPFITLLFAVAFVVFLWGVFEFIRGADNEDARKKGGKNIQWGIIGMVIMFAVYGIIRVILSTFGISATTFPF